MERKVTNERVNWTDKISEVGLTFNYYSPDGTVVDPTIPYWIEGAYYQFTPQIIESIKRATYDLHQVCTFWI